MLAIMFPLFFYAKCAGTFFRTIMKKISDASAKVSEISQECFGNIRTVKAFGTEDYQTQINMEKLGILYEEEKKKANFSAVHEFVMTGCMFGCMDAIIWMSSYLYFNYSFSIGKINSFNSYFIDFAFLTLLAKSGSSWTGKTFSISSKSRLSSEGALSEPHELELLQSEKMSAVCRRTASRPLRRCFDWTSLLLCFTFSSRSK